MPSYQYRKYHYGDKTVVRLSDLHNGISFTGKTTSLYWIWALFLKRTVILNHNFVKKCNEQNMLNIVEHCWLLYKQALVYIQPVIAVAFHIATDLSSITYSVVHFKVTARTDMKMKMLTTTVKSMLNSLCFYTCGFLLEWKVLHCSW